MPSKSRGVRNHYIGLVTCIDLVITVSAFLKTGKTLINNVKLSRTIPTWLQGVKYISEMQRYFLKPIQ